MAEFKGWPKIPRLFREMVVTEKIDGTNGAVVIEKYYKDGSAHQIPSNLLTYIGSLDEPDYYYGVFAQSRNRFVNLNSDNAGFARWVSDNASVLVDVLGEGYHYGEWWGQGIQRGYNLDHKRFSLFNVNRWAHLECTSPLSSLSVVPVLYEGVFNTGVILDCVDDLHEFGSYASQGFNRPEGVCVYHTASGHLYKATIEADQAPKNAA